MAVAATLCFAGDANALEEQDCRLDQEGMPAVFARCATLEVPEDPSRPDGPSLPLFVARIPALTSTPALDPLVLINGGPGGSTVDLYLQARPAFAPALRDRDIILLDQRGTGRSLSGLTCEVPDELELEVASPEVLREAVTTCVAAFPRDPRLFTTSIAVRDLEALRVSLGSEQLSLYGVSYGTRVAQHYLRRYPERVRAVILDGIVPAELVLGPNIAPDAQAALDAIFARCETESGCAERFEDLPRKFGELHDRFRGDSIELTIADPNTGQPMSFELGEAHMRAVIRLMSYSDATVALLPLVIDEAFAGNYAPMAGQANLLIQSVAESLGFAMHNAVVCTEDVPHFSSVADDSPNAYLGSMIVDGLEAICEVWPDGVVDEDFKDPVASDTPALLLSGEFDPVTPPEYGQRVIDGGLVNSIHVIGPGKGHGLASIGCVPQLMRALLAAAQPSDVDTECLDAEGPMPFFMSFQGPAP